MGDNTVKIVTLNIWQEQGPWRRRLDLIVDGLKSLAVDVVCLQEVRQVPSTVPNQAGILADALGMHCEFEAVETWGGGDEGLAILSRQAPADTVRFSLPTAEGRSKRKLLGIAVESESHPVWFFTTHLAYRPGDGLLREAQVLAADQFITACRVQGPAVLAGDFNAVPQSDEIRFLLGQTTLQGRRTFYQDAFSSMNPNDPGITWAAANPYTKPLAWLGLDRRLDYIFVTPMKRDGVGGVSQCRLVFENPNDDGIFCSDHYGILAEIAVCPSAES